ncbi:hypothetical protein DKX38_003429 [Salix brachista]|uniref:WRKY domain-containing protein n=1 Tax=Salix brachista TaxID=2182728 RepID=A0A5N5NSZ9_9ROSI|nr:hypothetical protein DKX38_003429 [Salix brachista]
MDAKATRSPPPTFQVPVKLIRTTDHHHDSSLPSDIRRRTVIDEMDFFADRKHGADHMMTIISNNTDHDLKDSGSPAGLELSVNTGLNLLTTNSSSEKSTVDDGVSSKMEDKRSKSELAVLQAEVERMKVENLRLKGMLNHVTSNYNALQMDLITLMPDQNSQHDGKNKNNGIVPRQLMDLGLAAATGGAGDTEDLSLSTSEGGRRRDRSRSSGNNAENNNEDGTVFEQDKKGLSGRGTDQREESPDQVWGSNKVARFNSEKTVDQTEATIRKARVSVRARSEDAMVQQILSNFGWMSMEKVWTEDGERKSMSSSLLSVHNGCWLPSSKTGMFPLVRLNYSAPCAFFRGFRFIMQFGGYDRTVIHEVQRCAEDRTILTTTYEGNHNHPLPPAAMAMASTTSSAARMLLSGSMPSADGLMNSNFLARSILPCSSSLATISASAPFPTVTLDLTQNPNPLQIPNQPTQFQVPFPNPPQNLADASAAALLPQIFGQALYNQSQFSGLQMSQDQQTDRLGHQSQPALQQGQRNSLADSLATATAAIKADPNFTAALAAAITSIIGGVGEHEEVSENGNGDDADGEVGEREEKDGCGVSERESHGIETNL